MTRSIHIKYLVAILVLSSGCGKKELLPEDGAGYVVNNEEMVWLPYEEVDLGLSVKWGERNIGAVSPADYGDYFAWGDVSCHYEAGDAYNMDDVTWSPNKVGYSRETYIFTDNSLLLSKYCTNSEYGPSDGKGVLRSEDDVASVRLESQWRIPTDSEWSELRDPDNCTWEWTTMNGVSGYRVTSLKPGFTENWIFLPAAGERVGCVLYDFGTVGSYWASTVYRKSPDFAWGLDFSKNHIYNYRTYRYYGRTVRPVYGKGNHDPEDYDFVDSGPISIGNEGFQYQ